MIWLIRIIDYSNYEWLVPGFDFGCLTSTGPGNHDGGLLRQGSDRRNLDGGRDRGVKVLGVRLRRGRIVLTGGPESGGATLFPKATGYTREIIPFGQSEQVINMG